MIRTRDLVLIPGRFVRGALIVNSVAITAPWMKHALGAGFSRGKPEVVGGETAPSRATRTRPAIAACLPVGFLHKTRTRSVEKTSNRQMETMMPTNETDWVATETVWGDAAYEEIKNAFPGKLKSREVALCVWCYGRHSDITEKEIEAIAQLDPVIMELRRQKKISAHGQRRAKSLLGLDANPEDDIDPSPSNFERKVLLDLRATAALLDAYKKTEARMRKAEAAFEVARAKLLAVTPQSARNLAEFEPKTRTLLAVE